MSAYNNKIRHYFSENDVVYQSNWLQLNNYKYRDGILILHNSHLFVIHNILSVNNCFYFLGKKCDVIEFDKFLNSFKIRENEYFDLELINVNNLKIKTPYEIFKIGNESYVISDTLELRHSLELQL